METIFQVTGGGGYTKENVARCWTVETGVLVDTPLRNGIRFYFILILFFHLLILIREILSFCFHCPIAEIPDNDYSEYFAPDYTLKIPNSSIVG